MEKQVLYHGSDQLIAGVIQPRQASDASQEENAQLAVYATDRLDCAKGMSLTGSKWSYADYEDEPFIVTFVEEPPTPHAPRYVYELSAALFTEDPPGSHQWVAHQEVPILKTHVFTTEELAPYWRMATPDERRAKEQEMNQKHPG